VSEQEEDVDDRKQHSFKLNEEQEDEEKLQNQAAGPSN
jgi:hypothetical protein